MTERIDGPGSVGVSNEEGEKIQKRVKESLWRGFVGQILTFRKWERGREGQGKEQIKKRCRM